MQGHRHTIKIRRTWIQIRIRGRKNKISTKFWSKVMKESGQLGFHVIDDSSNPLDDP